MRIVDKTPVGRRILRFAVIADTHVNQSENEASSFFPLNRLANARSRAVAAMVNKLAPAFVLHLGDIVHPLPGKTTYDAAARCFREIYSGLDAPLMLTPGNHDIGDKPGASAPVATINSTYIDIYRRTFGEPWYSFDQGEVHFVVINAPVINSGLAEEEDQRRWLEADLMANARRRVFVAIHYPPFVHDVEEPGHYDNLDEPGRGWLLGLIERFSVEAVFCGHVHNFWYDQYKGAEIYIAPSTAFVRQDYSEFMRVTPPGDEGGRADVNKLGLFIVDVHDRGHVAMWVHTLGETSPVDCDEDVVLPDYEIHTKNAAIRNLGIDLRHPWAEVVELPPSGALEEFTRKRARNDYPLCAIWDMGICLLRVPLQDLLDPVVRNRMWIARSVGNRFIVSMFGIPKSPAVLDILSENAELLDSIEVTLPEADMPAGIPHLRALRTRVPAPVFLAKLRRAEDSVVDGLRYGHLIFYGWVQEEWDRARALCDMLKREGLIDGLVFRVGRPVDPERATELLLPRVRELGLDLMLNVRLAGDSPAGCENDDQANVSRVDSVARLARAHPNVRFYLDTFMDVDRGYFMRTGLLDRSYNLRRAGEILRKHGVLARREAGAV